MRLLSLARVLFTFLAFQLALGMQVGVAYASTHSTPPPAHQSSATTSTDDACAIHKQAAERHDCCKASGCQCQCGNVPLAFNLPMISGAAAATIVRPLRATRFAAAPADTHFRPPIAS